MRAALSVWLQTEAARAHADLGRYRVLDVGSGIKPYLPYFEPYADSYVGVDIGNPAADLEGSVEALPVADGAFDVVLCTQVLEHVEDPARAVRELHRVTSPGGRVLASTHGVQVYHPLADRLLALDARGARAAVHGERGLVVRLRDAGRRRGHLPRRHVRRLRRPALPQGPPDAALQGDGVDAQLPRRPGRQSGTSLRAPILGSLFLNYHVVADKPK